MTKVEAAKAVAILQAAYPRSAVSDETVALYESMLSDLTLEVVQGAIRKLICTSTFLPSIAEIRAAAADIVVGPKRTGSEAWGDVLRAIRRFGSYRSPEFDDPLVARAVASLGWRNLCLGDSSEASDRARFAEVYDSFAAREREETQAAPQLAPAGKVGELVAGIFRALPKAGER